MARTTFKLEEEVTSLSESSQGEVGDNREKWGDFWEKSIAINRKIVSRPLCRYPPCELSEREVTSPSNLKVVGALDNYSLVFVIFINFFGQLKD
jgi:hypothetical protein